MKRDKELLKKILLYADNYKDGFPYITIEVLSEYFKCSFDISVVDFMQHGQMLFDLELARGEFRKGGVLLIKSITQDGYNFIYNALDDKV